MNESHSSLAPLLVTRFRDLINQIANAPFSTWAKAKYILKVKNPVRKVRLNFTMVRQQTKATRRKLVEVKDCNTLGILQLWEARVQPIKNPVGAVQKWK